MSSWTRYYQYLYVKTLPWLDLKTFKHNSDKISLWKANIDSIHKKGGKQTIKNYHSVSLLPTCGKIFESLIYDAMFVLSQMSHNSEQEILALIKFFRFLWNLKRLSYGARSSWDIPWYFQSVWNNIAWWSCSKNSVTKLIFHKTPLVTEIEWLF